VWVNFSVTVKLPDLKIPAWCKILNYIFYPRLLRVISKSICTKTVGRDSEATLSPQNSLKHTALKALGKNTSKLKKIHPVYLSNTGV